MTTNSTMTERQARATLTAVERIAAAYRQFGRPDQAAEADRHAAILRRLASGEAVTR